MTDQISSRTPDFAVWVDGDCAPQLHIKIGTKDVPLGITPAQCASLGPALLSASALCSTGEKPPHEGTEVGSCELPVLQAAVGVNNRTGMPLLVVRLHGGGELVLSFTCQTAKAISSALSDPVPFLRELPQYSRTELLAP